MQDWLLNLASSLWVYPALTAFAAIDGIFPPIPSESVVIALGALSSSGGTPVVWAIMLFAAIGAFTGDQVAYTVGSMVNVRGLRILRSAKGQAAITWAERALAHRGSSFILAARYIPIGRVAVNLMAGSLGYPRRRFVGLTALAAITWGIYGTMIGYVTGKQLEGEPVLAVVIGVAFGLTLGVVIDLVLRRVFGAKEPGAAMIRTAPGAADGTRGGAGSEQGAAASDSDTASGTAEDVTRVPPADTVDLAVGAATVAVQGAAAAAAVAVATVPAPVLVPIDPELTDGEHRNVRHMRQVLADHGVAGEIRQVSSSTRTAAEAAAVLGVPVGAIASSLVFLLDDEPVLVLTSGAHRVDQKVVGAALGGTLRKADAAAVRAATGQPIGGVGPVGHPSRLRTVIDRALASHSQVWAAAGTPHAVFPTTFDELVRITGGQPADVSA